MAASHVGYTFSPPPWPMPCRSGRKRALFHSRELSCNWNNAYCIRAHNHVKVSCFGTGKWALTFSRGLWPQETAAAPVTGAQINVLARRPHIPPPCLSSPAPPFPWRSYHSGGGESYERTREEARQPRRVCEGDVSQRRLHGVPASLGLLNASSLWNEGPLHPVLQINTPPR